MEGTVTKEVTIDPISYVLHICNVYVSMLLSQFIPPSPSSAVSKKSVLYVRVSILALQIGSSVPFF